MPRPARRRAGGCANSSWAQGCGAAKWALGPKPRTKTRPVTEVTRLRRARHELECRPILGARARVNFRSSGGPQSRNANEAHSRTPVDVTECAAESRPRADSEGPVSIA
eukprot:457257-Alexandrium_andersonii.AAC.1